MRMNSLKASFSVLRNIVALGLASTILAPLAFADDCNQTANIRTCHMPWTESNDAYVQVFKIEEPSHGVETDNEFFNPGGYISVEPVGLGAHISYNGSVNIDGISINTCNFYSTRYQVRHYAYGQLVQAQNLTLHPGDNHVGCEGSVDAPVDFTGGGMCSTGGVWVSDCLMYNPGASYQTCMNWCQAEMY